jgi:polyhydroxyalkanoate synthesis regulator phasin
MSLKPKSTTSTLSEGLKNSPLGNDTQRNELMEKVRWLDKIRLSNATSKIAAGSLRNIEQRRVTALQNVECTALSLAEAQLRQTQVASCLTTIGSLTTQVNSQTAAVVGSLTSGLGAEMISHIKNRDSNNRVVNHLVQAGALSADEGQEITDVLYTVSREDMMAGEARARKSKAAVEALAAHAIDGLERTKDFLQ